MATGQEAASRHRIGDIVGDRGEDAEFHAGSLAPGERGPRPPNANGGRHCCRPPLSAVVRSAEAFRRTGARVPAEALRPRSVPFRVPFRSRSSFQVPRAIHRSELRWDPFRVAARASPDGLPRDRHRTEIRRLLFPVPFGANSAGFRAGAVEANFAGSLSRFHRPKALVPLDGLEESGVGFGLRLCLTLLPRSARPSSFVGVPEGPPLPLWATAVPSSLRFRRNRLPGRIRTVAAPIDSRQHKLPVDNGDNGDKILT